MTTLHLYEFVRVTEPHPLGGMTGTVRGFTDGLVAVKLTAWGRLVKLPASRLASEDTARLARIRAEAA